jgi:hypothetical protein
MPSAAAIVILPVTAEMSAPQSTDKAARRLLIPERIVTELS